MDYYAPGASPAVPDPNAGLVQADVPCRKCGVNLRGFYLGNRCPSCGTPVGRSVQGDLLHYSDPAWLHAVRDGASWVIWGIISFVGIAIIGGLALGAYAVTQVQRSSSPEEMVEKLRMPITILAGVVVLVSALVAMGVFKLMTPEPGSAASGLELAGRLAAVVWLLIGALSVALQSTVEDPMRPGTLQLVTAVAQALVQGTLLICIGLVTSRLASRVPDRRLAERLRTCAVGAAICMIVVGILPMFIGQQNGRPSSGATGVGCINGVAALTGLVLIIVMLVALGKLAGLIKQAASYARQVYAQPVGQAAGGAAPTTMP